MIDLADAFLWLPLLADRSVDHIITDPPYSEHVETGQAVSGRRTGQAVIRKATIGVGFMSPTQVLALAAESCRIARRWILIFCAFEQLHEYKSAIEICGGRYVRCAAWEKPDSTPQLSGDRPATWGECLVVAHAPHKGAMRWNAGGKRGLYRAGVCRGAERSEHPTQKPLGLMRELIEDFTDPNDLVIDPFVGSGSTGVACLMTGRRFSGCELDPKYHAIAVRRLAGDECRPIPQQASLFGDAP